MNLIDSALLILILALSIGGASSLWFNRREGFKKRAEAAKPPARKLDGGGGPPGGRRVEIAAVQEFFVPFPEASLLEDTFKQINPIAGGVIHSLVSLSISTDKTVIWYDHHEDGYDKEYNNPERITTQIWGDGNMSNGCRPLDNNEKCESDEDDVFKAGDAVVLENEIDTTITFDSVEGWDLDNVMYDGADRIMASFPIAVTRGCFPDYPPGGFMAGAVEVLDTEYWGKEYVLPLGQNTNSKVKSFEFTGIYLQAKEDDTVVTIPGAVDQEVLDRGDSLFFRVPEVGKTVHATKPVQVDIVTGDVYSMFELRWFTLRPLDQWSNEYISPVGTEHKNAAGVKFGFTQIVLYNPNDEFIEVEFEYLGGGKKDNFRSQIVEVPPNKNRYTDYVPKGSGACLKSKDTFVAFSIIDSDAGESGKGEESGAVFDWGFPVMPKEYLTPQVLVGWGHGCANLLCDGKGHSRSVVWVTALENADIYADNDNDGIIDNNKTNVGKLQGKIFKDDGDTGDDDMSGAVIWATVQGEGPYGTPVPIAAAWGQDPAVSNSSDDAALDLGTVVLPFTTISATKSAMLVEDNQADLGTEYEGVVSFGDTIEYIITISNVGQKDLPPRALVITDVLDDHVSYISNTTWYSSPNEVTSDMEMIHCDDDLRVGNTKFPIDADGNGLLSQTTLARRGGTHEISFLARLHDDVSMNGVSQIVNHGYAEGGGVRIPFRHVYRLMPQSRSIDRTAAPTTPPTDDLDPSAPPSVPYPEKDDELCLDEEDEL